MGLNEQDNPARVDISNDSLNASMELINYYI